MPKKDKKKSIKSYTRNPVLMIGLAVVLPLVGYIGYQKYLDWQNSTSIKKISEHFPQLAADLENETGKKIIIKNDCFTTTEKYSEGVANCEVSFFWYSENEPVPENYNLLVKSNELFANISKESSVGAQSSPGKYVGCSYAKDRISVGCIYVTRPLNKPLAADLLNEEVLNQKKNEALSQ